MGWSVARGLATALGAAEVLVNSIVGLTFVLTGTMSLAYAFLVLSFAQVPVVLGLWRRDRRARRWAVVVFGIALAVTAGAAFAVAARLDMTPLLVIDGLLFGYALGAFARYELPSRVPWSG